MLFFCPLLFQEGKLLYELVKEAGGVVFAEAERREQCEHGEPSLASHTRACGDFPARPLLHIKVEPFPSERMDGALHELVLVDVAQTETLAGLEDHAGRANELRDHDSLGAVDDKGAPLGHLRELADEDGLLLDLAGHLVDEPGVHEDGDGVGEVFFYALLHRVLGRQAELFVVKVELELQRIFARMMHDGRGGAKRLCQAVLHQVVKRILLNCNEIGQFGNFFQVAETVSFTNSGQGSLLQCWDRQGRVQAGKAGLKSGKG